MSSAIVSALCGVLIIVALWTAARGWTRRTKTMYDADYLTAENARLEADVARLERELAEEKIRSKNRGKAAESMFDLWRADAGQIARLMNLDDIAAEYGISAEIMLTLAKSQIATAARNAELERELAEIEDILYAPDGTEIVTLDRLRELVQAIARLPSSGTLAISIADTHECSIGGKWYNLLDLQKLAETALAEKDATK